MTATQYAARATTLKLIDTLPQSTTPDWILAMISMTQEKEPSNRPNFDEIISKLNNNNKSTTNIAERKESANSKEHTYDNVQSTNTATKSNDSVKSVYENVTPTTSIESVRSEYENTNSKSNGSVKSEYENVQTKKQ